jgi:hypothetical protein
MALVAHPQYFDEFILPFIYHSLKMLLFCRVRLKIHYDILYKVLLMLRNSLGCYSKSPHLITMTILVAKLQYFISVKTVTAQAIA